MDSGLAQVISNTREVVQSCQKQLHDLQKDPVKNAELIQALQQTYQQANETLVAAQAASAKQVTRPTTTNHAKKNEESHRMTRAEYRRLHDKGQI